MTDYVDMLGKPYVKGTYGPDSYDCWGAVYEVMRRLGRPVPRWDVSTWEGTQQYATFLEERAKDVWQPLAGPQEAGDIGIARNEPGTCHACVCVSPGYVLHAAGTMGVLIEPVDRFLQHYKRTTWARRA